MKTLTRVQVTVRAFLAKLKEKYLDLRRAIKIIVDIRQWNKESELTFIFSNILSKPMK